MEPTSRCTAHTCRRLTMLELGVGASRVGTATRCRRTVRFASYVRFGHWNRNQMTAKLSKSDATALTRHIHDVLCVQVMCQWFKQIKDTEVATSQQRWLRGGKKQCKATRCVTQDQGVRLQKLNVYQSVSKHKQKIIMRKTWKKWEQQWLEALRRLSWSTTSETLCWNKAEIL